MNYYNTDNTYFLLHKVKGIKLQTIHINLRLEYHLIVSVIRPLAF